MYSFSSLSKAFFFALGLFCLSSASVARPLWDEMTVSFGLARHDFRDYRLDTNHSPDFIAQHYKASSPTFQMTWDREFTQDWHTQWSLDLHYDFNLESENTLSNGAYVFDAHSWSAEMKSLLLFETDHTNRVKIGLGAGVGNYALITNIDETAEYTHHINLMAPIFHIDKKYTIFGLEGQWAAEIGRLDFYYFSGIRYSMENVLWIKRTPEVDQGFRVEYVYWNLDQGKMRHRQWMRDFHGISWCLEFLFK